MATQAQIEATYNYMDQVFRLTFGENADISGAMFNGDFSKTLEQAQEEKHNYILDNLKISEGSRIIDIGCGWGPLLKAAKMRGANGVGLTLSSKQAESCRSNGLKVYVRDWKEPSVLNLGTFDGVISVGAFEHFCSVDEYLAGKQELVYKKFFELCHALLELGGRIFLQTMMWGKNAPPYQEITLQAPKGSNQYLLAVLSKFYPGTWLPAGVDQIVSSAKPYFKLLSLNNGRLDYIETMTRWRQRVWKLTLPKAWAALKLLPYLITDKDFRYRIESLRGTYNKECFKREIMDHQRMVFERASG